MPRGVLTIAALLLALVATTWAQQPEADRLVKEYFAAQTDDARAAVLKTINDNADITIRHVEDGVRRGVFYTKQPTGIVQRKIKVEFDGQETDCTLYIPDDYDPAKAYPTLVVMHGTGGTGDRFIRRWLPYIRKRKMIGIAPTAVSGYDERFKKAFGRGHGYGTQEVERSVPISAINAARRDYHIDSDRIYLAGCSMGGHCAWDSAITRSDYFAGAIVEAGIPLVEGYQLARSVLLPNLFNVRMYVMQGTPDKDQPKVNRRAVLQLQRLDYQAEYRQFDGKGHGTYPEGSDASLDFVTQGTRDLYPKEITKVIHRVVHGRAYWTEVTKLKGKEWDPARKIQIKVKEQPSKAEFAKMVEKRIKSQLATVRAQVRPKNVIDIRVRNVREIVVYLHDRLIDMDKPVVIHVNGRRFRRRKFRRNIGFMLEEVRKTHDIGRTYYNRTTLRVN